MPQNKKFIDSHWHLYSLKDKNGQDFRDVLDAFQQQSGLTAMNICSIPVYHSLGPAQNILAALYKLHNPTAYAYAGLVYPQCPFQKPMPEGTDPLSQYEELMQLGFDGIKMLETKPTEQKQYAIRIDDPYFDSFFAACEKDNTPMIWHVADPDTFWDIDRIPKRFLDRGWFYGDGTYLSYEQTYQQVYNVLEKHPNLAVTFAHFFFLSEQPEKLEALFAKYPNVSVDITPGAEMFAAFRENHTFYRDFFARHADRIVLGSDIYFPNSESTPLYQRLDALRRFIETEDEVKVIVENCPGLCLPEDAQEKILGGNFLKAAGDTPRSVDPKALKAYVEKYQHLISDPQLRQGLLEEVKDF